MNEKITALHISDVLSVKLTFPKHVTDSFMRALHETIVQGLMTDGIVKVRGLGTFRIVDMESRESVSVSTGERIVIPSFKKIAFTAEDAVTERMTNLTVPTDKPAETAEATEAAEPAATTEPTETEDIPAKASADVPTVEEFFSVIEEEDTTPVEETPADGFSGIDVLIATPESLEELYDRLAVAKAEQDKAGQTVAAAQAQLDSMKAQVQEAEHSVEQAQQQADDAQAQVAHIEQLIRNVETNRLTDLAEAPQQAPAEEEPQAEDAAEEVATSAAGPEALPPQEEGGEEPEPVAPAPWWRIPLILLILLIVGAACYFVAVNPKQPLQWFQLDPQENVAEPTQPVQQPTPQPKPQQPEAAPKPQPSDAESQPQQPAEPKAEQPAAPKPEQPAEPARPKTHKIRRGDTLTKISMQYYGTKDSVRAIIRANNFRDPNNINEGAVVKLP